MAVVQEPARRQKAFVTQKLASDLCSASGVAIVDVVDGAHIVHTTASDEIARRSESDRHDPGRAQGYDLDLVARPCIPNDELAVE